MTLETGDNLTKPSLEEACTSSLYSDAYQFPKLTDNTSIKEGKYEKVAMACDPYWDMVLASESLRKGAASNGAIDRMVGVIDALHNVTNCGDFAGGRPQALQQALRGMDGMDQEHLKKLENILRDTMHTDERGINLSLGKDQTGRVTLYLSRTVDGQTTKIDVSGTSCIAITGTDRGKTTSVGPRQAFDNILPLTAPPQRNEI